MIVLETWLAGMFGDSEHRLVVTPAGNLRVHHRDYGRWSVCEQDECLPLFAPTKTPRRPASTSARRRRSPRG